MAPAIIAQSSLFMASPFFELERQSAAGACGAAMLMPARAMWQSFISLGNAMPAAGAQKYLRAAL